MRFTHLLLAILAGVASVLAAPAYSDVFRSAKISAKPSTSVPSHLELVKPRPELDQTNRETEESTSKLAHRDATKGSCRIQADGRVYQLQKGFAYELEVDALFVGREIKCAEARASLDKTNSTIMDWWCKRATDRDAKKEEMAGTMLRFASWCDLETFTDDQINLEVRKALDTTYPGVKFVENNICSFAESLEPIDTTGLGDNVDLPEEYEDDVTRSKRLQFKNLSRRQVNTNHDAIKIPEISPNTATCETTSGMTKGQLTSYTYTIYIEAPWSDGHDCSLIQQKLEDASVPSAQKILNFHCSMVHGREDIIGLFFKQKFSPDSSTDAIAKINDVLQAKYHKIPFFDINTATGICQDDSSISSLDLRSSSPLPPLDLNTAICKTSTTKTKYHNKKEYNSITYNLRIGADYAEGHGCPSILETLSSHSTWIIQEIKNFKCKEDANGQTLLSFKQTFPPAEGIGESAIDWVNSRLGVAYPSVEFRGGGENNGLCRI